MEGYDCHMIFHLENFYNFSIFKKIKISFNKENTMYLTKTFFNLNIIKFKKKITKKWIIIKPTGNFSY